MLYVRAGQSPVTTRELAAAAAAAAAAEWG